MDLVTMILACSIYADNSITNAVLQVGSKNNPLTVSVAGDNSRTFKNESDASNFISQQLKDGKDVEIGVMQIPHHWLKNYHTSTTEALRPCKNISVASQILVNAQVDCSNKQVKDLPACALSIYKTGDSQAGLDYAQKVLEYAKQHPFAKLEAAAKAKNPQGFEMPESEQSDKDKEHK